MELKNIDWSAVLGGVGKVATVFNPAIGGGLIVASQVVEKMNNDELMSNDEVLKNDVIGLTRCSEIVKDFVEKSESGEAPTLDNLKVVYGSLESLDLLLNKTVSIMK